MRATARALAAASATMALLAAAAAWGGDGGAGAASHPGFLWDASRDGHRIVLMGTIHVGASAEDPLDAPARQRIAQADAIVLEDDITQQERSQAAAARWAMYPAGEPGLDTRIDAGLKAGCERLLARDGIPEQAAWRMKPWMLAMEMVLLDSVAQGYSPGNATEAWLAKAAAAAHKPILELEGIEAQLAMLDAAPAAEQVEFLRQTVHSLEDGEAETELKDLTAAWRSGDSQAMLRHLDQVRNSPEPAERRWFERMVTRRNATMAESIDRLAQDGHLYLVAVGSLHYFGDDGLVELLRRRGYVVTRVAP